MPSAPIFRVRALSRIGRIDGEEDDHRSGQEEGARPTEVPKQG